MSLAPEEKISCALSLAPAFVPTPPRVLLPLTVSFARVVHRYKEGGPAALANFESGVQGFTARAFRGCGVVTSDPFEVSDDTEAIQMLQRFSQVGEHYIMSAPDVADDTEGSADILIYDEERDVHVKITFKDAAVATGLFDAAGTVKTTAAGKPNDTDTLAGGLQFSDYAAGVKDIIEKKYKSANAKKVAICLARPFIEHAMLSAVLTVSGQDTGATIFGPSDMQVGAASLLNTSLFTSQFSLC
jgi:hypothetical protein